MENNKGITLITVVTAVVIIIILAAVTIYYGLTQNSEKAVETKTVYEVYSLLDAVNNRALMNKINPAFYTFVGKNDFGTMEVGSGADKKSYDSSEGWYLVSTMDDFSELGLDNVKGEYLVNYEKGLAVSTAGVFYEDVVYYSLNELKKVMGGGTTVLSRVEYDEEKKVNKPVLSTGMVPVKLYGSNWVVTSEADEAWYDYSSGQMAWANVMLKDELAVEGYTNEQVKNASLSELEGKIVTVEGSAYVWIPRYSATSIGDAGSKVIFSNLIDDVTELNGESYSVPSSFKYGTGENEMELTGIWVSKYEAGFDK